MIATAQKNTTKIPASSADMPKLRFPGFSGKWKEKRLGEVCDFFDNKRIPLKSTDRKKRTGRYPYYGASGIIDYIDDYIFDGEYILLGEDGANIIDRSSRLVFLARDRFWVNNHAHVLQAHGSNYFLSEYLESLRYEKYNTGTAQPKLNSDVVKKIKIFLPSLLEQQKIADFFGSVDAWIENLHAQKESLESYKKGMMQKIFSQEIRFKDDGGNNFSGWEEKKLGEIGEIATGTTPPITNREYYDGDFPWVTPTDIDEEKDIYTSVKLLTKKGIDKGRFIPKDSLLVTCIASIGKNTILRVDGSCNQQINAITPNKYNTVDFLYYLLEKNKNVLIRFAGAGGMQMLNKKDFSGLKFKIPSFLEQQKIAKFLTALDNLIELKQKQITLAEQWKKGLMQGLFV